MQGELTPVLVEVEHRELHGLTALHHHGEIGLAIAGIAVVEDGLLVLALEVFADLHEVGQNAVLTVQQDGTLQRTVGNVGVHVDVAVGGVTLDLHVHAVVEIGVAVVGIVELGALQIHAVGASQSIVAQGLAVKGLGGDRHR